MGIVDTMSASNYNPVLEPYSAKMSDFERFCEVSGVCPSSQELDDLKREIDNDCDEECRAAAYKNDEVRGLVLFCEVTGACDDLDNDDLLDFCQAYGECQKLSDKELVCQVNGDCPFPADMSDFEFYCELSSDCPIVPDKKDATDMPTDPDEENAM